MKRFLRFTGILLMGITAGVTLLGGVGTTCVALNPTSYQSMAAIAPFQWLYILFVLAGIGLGVLGIRTMVQLTQGKSLAERSALWVLITGVVIGGIHMMASRSLRGSSLPVDGVVYITALTLAFFLFLRLPGIQGMGIFQPLERPEADSAPGAAAIVIGFLILGVQYWVGPTHLYQGVNYADAFHDALLGSGLGAMVYGLGSLILPLYKKNQQGVNRVSLSQSGHRSDNSRPS